MATTFMIEGRQALMLHITAAVVEHQIAMPYWLLQILHGLPYMVKYTVKAEDMDVGDAHQRIKLLY